MEHKLKTLNMDSIKKDLIDQLNRTSNKDYEFLNTFMYKNIHYFILFNKEQNKIELEFRIMNQAGTK